MEEPANLSSRDISVSRNRRPCDSCVSFPLLWSRLVHGTFTCWTTGSDIPPSCAHLANRRRWRGLMGGKGSALKTLSVFGRAALLGNVVSFRAVHAGKSPP